MFKAIDVKTNKMVFASKDEVYLQSNYICPCCGKEVRNVPAVEKRPYFRHNKNEACEYYRYSSSDNVMSEWHSEWQSCFPMEHTEKIVSIGEKKRVADVCIGNTIVEFQHSSISEDVFYERTNFYLKNDYSIVWVFDANKAFDEVRLDYYDICNHRMKWKWKNPIRALRHFNYFKEVYGDKFDIYIECEDFCYKVTWANDNFSRFVSYTRMNKPCFIYQMKDRGKYTLNEFRLIDVTERQGVYKENHYHNYSLVIEDKTGYKENIILKGLYDVLSDGVYCQAPERLNACVGKKIKHLITYNAYGKKYVKRLEF